VELMITLWLGESLKSLRLGQVVAFAHVYPLLLSLAVS
jgi:hypothetical protein